MYAAEVGKQKLTFGVSGMLWNRSLVMYDKETGTLWSHILGEAMQGNRHCGAGKNVVDTSMGIFHYPPLIPAPMNGTSLPPW